MASSSPNPSTADLVDGTLAVAGGVGIVTLALFSLAIPIFGVDRGRADPAADPAAADSLAGG